MKRVTTTITEEFDENGKLKTKITETSEETDNGYIYPQIYPYYLPNPIITYDSTGVPKINDWTTITCNSLKGDNTND